MARGNIPVVAGNRSGISLGSAGSETNGDSTNNHQLLNDGRVFLLVRASGAGSVTVTLDIPGTVDGAAITDPTVSIPSGESKLIGPFPASTYNQAGGVVHIDVDSNDARFQAFRI